MARKSRKQHLLTPKVTKQAKFQAAIYARRSAKDLRENIDNSLTMQEELVKDYLKDKPEFVPVKVYQDNGYSGTNFHRPGFEEMMKDIKSGRINTIVVKDLSRFGRNYIEVGDYLEKILPFMGVRFISINDCYDNFATSFSEELMMHLLNITNDMYAKDISAKITPTLKAKQERGEFLGPYPTFGYLRNPENPKRLVVDPEAVDTVRTIFGLRETGMEIVKIVKYLAENGVMTPNEYRLRKGLLKSEKFQNSTWTIYMVSTILKNETYLGHTVSRRTKTSLTTGDKTRVRPKEDWIFVENTHEPIISRELFEKVTGSTPKRSKKSEKQDPDATDDRNKENLFKGLVVCSTCGTILQKCRVMSRKRDGTEIVRYYYEHPVSHYIHHAGQCNYKSIVEDKIIEAVTIALLERQLFEQQVLEKQGARSKDVSPSMMRVENAIRTKELTRKKADLDSLKVKAFEDFISEKMSREEYNKIAENHQAEMEGILCEQSILQQQTCKPVQIPTTEVGTLELTQELVQAKLEKIVIHPCKSVQVMFKESDQAQGGELCSEVTHAT